MYGLPYMKNGPSREKEQLQSIYRDETFETYTFLLLCNSAVLCDIQNVVEQLN